MILSRRISQRILMAKYSPRIFGLVFPGFRPPQKFHAQDSRPKFLSNLTFLNPILFHADSLLAGEAKNYQTEIVWESIW